ncbi:MAG: DUF2231 domain-containing protein [Gemmatimonadales bacterium]
MDPFPQHSWHPMVIHFPLVGLLLAVALDAFAAWTGSSRWRETATLLWWVGLLGAAAAVATGLIAYNRVEHSELAHARMTLHRNLALATFVVLLGAAFWRWRQPASRGPAFIGAVGAFGLLAVGNLGGELVFRHAIGMPTETVEQVMMERGGHEHGHAVTRDGAAHPDSADTDSAPDSSETHGVDGDHHHS